MDDKEKMKQGMWYDANNNPEIVKDRYNNFDLCFELNQTKPSDMNTKNDILTKIFGYLPDNLEIVTPFICDYGKNIHLGSNVFINCNCYLMDGASISIGSNVFIGPYCGFYTAAHPIEYKKRNQGLEKALPITIKDNCWFGANVSVMPGVTIGSGCVIAAGSVVTKDMPDNSMIAGVPAKVIKEIKQD
ncbi:MAG: sugar O-acetyltransferase [Thomasclavelia sp.]|nr:sugar O-acetyltransferase [Thomasclavelia sp.]